MKEQSPHNDDFPEIKIFQSQNITYLISKNKKYLRLQDQNGKSMDFREESLDIIKKKTQGMEIRNVGIPIIKKGSFFDYIYKSNIIKDGKKLDCFYTIKRSQKQGPDGSYSNEEIHYYKRIKR